MIGQSPRRREDERLLTGRGRFVDDIRLPDLLHMALVRSTHARARLVRVDLTEARAQPGVLAFAAPDLSGLDAPLPVRGAETTNPYVVLDTPRPQHVLARDEVRHVGEAIAVILAPDPYRATDAAAAVAIDYEPLPAVMDAERAMQEDAPRIHAGQSNVVGRLRAVIGDVDKAFAEADVVVEESLAHGRVSSMALEPRA
ncbi:MAG TPA: xanthine dehydrogenase family protein molybdopterin-binding subunit, partial [Solirubrobacteraceae bacterium]